MDESPLGAALDGVDGRLTLPARWLLAEAEVGSDDRQAAEARQRLRFLRRLVADVIEGVPNGPLPRAAFIARGLSPESCAEARRLEWRTKRDVKLTGDMTQAEREAALQAAAINRDLTRRARFWKALGTLLTEDGPSESGWLALADDRDNPGERLIVMKGRREVQDGWKGPVLALDATADLNLLRYVLPGIECAADIRIAQPHVRVRQVIDQANSLQRLDVGGAKDDAERRHRERNLRDAHAIIAREARRHGDKPVLVIAQKRIEERLPDLGRLPANIRLGHHNGLRGIDAHGDAAAIIVLGRTQPSSAAVTAMAEALTGRAMAHTGYQRAEAVRELLDGSMQTATVLRHPDPVAEALRWQACEAELVQLIGRGRGVNRTVDNPLDVLMCRSLDLT